MTALPSGAGRWIKRAWKLRRVGWCNRRSAQPRPKYVPWRSSPPPADAEAEVRSHAASKRLHSKPSHASPGSRNRKAAPVDDAHGIRLKDDCPPWAAPLPRAYPRSTRRSKPPVPLPRVSSESPFPFFSLRCSSLFVCSLTEAQREMSCGCLRRYPAEMNLRWIVRQRTR